MEEMGALNEALVLLAAAVIAAPLSKRLGFGTVLGYLAAGIIVGPLAGLVSGGGDILHIAELGIVLLLFIIGLELTPARLWTMRKAIFGLGLAQVVVTGAVLAAVGYGLFGVSYSAAIIAGFGMALSSTAFAMQILEQEGARNLPRGRTAFAILLFQDLAIVPLLAMVPLLAPGMDETEAFGLRQLALAAGAVAIMILTGRYILNPLFRVIGTTGAREAMVAAALLVVLGAAALAAAVGLSPGMGAFIAGVLLAESSYRHELEADIEPFRGILLGLFFMAVGLSLDLGVVVRQWAWIVAAVPTLMIAKTAITTVLARLYGHGKRDSLSIGLLLSQGGEFGFVLFSAAATAHIISGDLASLFIAIVTVSMALTPLANIVARRLTSVTGESETMEEDFSGAGADVLMIGFSRFGQIAAQTLLAGGIDVTVIDNSAERVRTVERFGFRIYFGDGTRKEVLEAAGIGAARVVLLCTNRKEVTDRIVDLIQANYPDVRLLVRSYDRLHALELRAKHVDYEIRETFESALLFGRKTLEALGASEEQALETVEDVRRRDEERLKLQASDGLQAGREHVFRKPVTPEPLVKPVREGKRLDTAA
jgi:CPA2 family monovalent cation:H+ antiporter-2